MDVATRRYAPGPIAGHLPVARALALAAALAAAGTIGATAAAAQPPPVPLAPLLTDVDYAPGGGGLTLQAAGLGRRTLLETLASETGFRLLFPEKVPDDPIHRVVTGVSLARFVQTLLREAGLDYVLVGRQGTADGVRVLIVATPGSPEAVAALRRLEDEAREARRARQAEQRAKDVALAWETATARRRTHDDNLDPLERSLRMEGEAVEPRVDPMAAPPVVIELPGAPQPIVVKARPVVVLLPVTATPLPAPPAPEWRAVTEADVMPPPPPPPTPTRPVKPPEPR